MAKKKDNVETIRIKIYPPMFCSFKNIDDRGWMTLPKGSKLSDALRAIKMPKGLAKVMMVKLNGLSEKMNTVLQDDDVIGFFSFISGG